MAGLGEKRCLSGNLFLPLEYGGNEGVSIAWKQHPNTWFELGKRKAKLKWKTNKRGRDKEGVAQEINIE